MTLIEAAKQAREALEWNLPVIEDWGGKDNLNLQHKAITALHQVISEAEGRSMSKTVSRSIADAEQQEPVAWYDAEKDCAYTLSDCEGRAQDDLEPLYLAPPSNPWQGLTDDDLRQIILVAIGVAEAKLKEKNT